MNKAPVSVLIPVKNERDNIAACILSVLWAKEIVVVDSSSTDGTAGLASSMGATVIQFNFAPGGLKKKNWTLKNYNFANDWILILDADERITPTLAEEIRSAVRNPNGKSGFYLNRRFFFLGKWIRHAGYYPSWNLRLFIRGRAKYEFVSDPAAVAGDNEVHEHMLLSGAAGHLSQPMDHFAYPDVKTFVEKHNRYSNWEAACQIDASRPVNATSEPGSFNTGLNAKRRIKRFLYQFPFPHWLRFLYHYVYKLGILDGAGGYFFCHLLAEYQFLIWLKRYEILRQTTPTPQHAIAKKTAAGSR